MSLTVYFQGVTPGRAVKFFFSLCRVQSDTPPAESRERECVLSPSPTVAALTSLCLPPDYQTDFMFLQTPCTISNSSASVCPSTESTQADFQSKFVISDSNIKNWGHFNEQFEKKKQKKSEGLLCESFRFITFAVYPPAWMFSHQCEYYFTFCSLSITRHPQEETEASSRK